MPNHETRWEYYGGGGYGCADSIVQSPEVRIDWMVAERPFTNCKFLRGAGGSIDLSLLRLSEGQASGDDQGLGRVGRVPAPSWMGRVPSTSGAVSRSGLGGRGASAASDDPTPRHWCYRCQDWCLRDPGGGAR